MYGVWNTAGTCLSHTDCSIHTIPAWTLHSDAQNAQQISVCYSDISKYLDQSDISLSLSASTIKHLHHYQAVASHRFKGTVTALKREQMLSAAAKQTWVPGLMTGALLNTMLWNLSTVLRAALGCTNKTLAQKAILLYKGGIFSPLHHMPRSRKFLYWKSAG